MNLTVRLPCHKESKISGYHGDVQQCMLEENKKKKKRRWKTEEKDIPMVGKERKLGGCAG